MSAVGPDWGALATGWQIAPGLLVLVAASGALYALGVRRVGRRRRRWPAGRSAAFGAGLAVLVAALASGVEARAGVQLSTHMLQHLLLTMVAAPLIVAGAPLSLALRATSGATHRRLAAAVRSRAARALTAPPVAFALFGVATIATHLTGFYEAAVRSPLLHGVEHQLYLVTALLFWLPLVGTNPLPQLRSFIGRTVYLLAAMPVMSLVGVVLVSSTSVRYDVYAGAGALADQEAAGALMWVGGTVLMAVALLVLGFQAMLAEERRQQARDALEAAA